MKSVPAFAGTTRMAIGAAVCLSFPRRWEPSDVLFSTVDTDVAGFPPSRK
jgi:hypothetical protein